MKYNGFVLWKCLIAFLPLCPLVKSQVFTAIVDFEPLLYSEGGAAKALDEYIEKQEEKLQNIKRIRDGYKNVYNTAMKDSTLFLENPVNAFLVIKHLTADWAVAKNLISGKVCNSSHAAFKDVESNFYFPTDEDLMGAAYALFRLQDTYQLSTTDLARGHIKGAKISSKMTASDCFELGYTAYEKSDYYHAGLWLEEALSQIEDEHPISIDKSFVLEYLAHVYFLIQDYRKAVKLTRQIMAEDPDHPLVHKNLEYFSAFLTAEEKRHLKSNDPTLETKSLARIHDLRPEPNPYFGDYAKLCRGGKVKTPEEEKHLKCRYTTNNSRYLLLQPAKEEVLSLQPRIVVYHNVISESDTQLFKDLAFPELKTATDATGKNAVLKTAVYRVSKSAWFDDDFHPRIARNTRVIEELMGLTGDTAEPMHVINYGIGGHYEPHHDYKKEDEEMYEGLGNRIATWIYYLSDVDAGGSTVFPDIGVEIKAEKGAAGMWFNLWRNGSGDAATKHAACPVLAGTKWVANKWFHEYENEFKRPCALDQRL